MARLLAIIAVLGLLTAPTAMPSIAATMEKASAAAKAETTSETTPMSETASMPDDMPCCPHDRPALPDCSKSCPFAVLCTGMFFPANSAAFVPVRLAVVDVKMPGDDIGRELLRDPPPPKPPRA